MNEKGRPDCFELDGGELRIWIEQDISICMKAVTRYGDPVELSEDEAMEVAKSLIEMVKRLEVDPGDKIDVAGADARLRPGK